MEIEEDYCHRHNLRQMNGSETNRQAEKLVPENVDNSPQIEYPNQ
jgi:hypothetical protein